MEIITAKESIMPRRDRAFFALVFALPLLLASGCGRGDGSLAPADAQEDLRKSTLREVGEMLTLYKASKGKPPAKVADLATFEVGFQVGYLRSKEGEVLIAWGAPIQEGAADTILACEKQAPASGGYVLMQDGQTVQKLTAEEFKSAKKAPGLATAGT
ncbi:hypothetical protein TA3x_003732 [Tundrisphaera sp. TA3]|uniref:hypothetical protein n=1 Tax=Tundrisphaera sp. TA3 TaxID=3435775 RepID=UPI003EB771E4